MGTHHGKEGVVKLGANQVAEVTDWSIDENVEAADDTAMGDAAQTHHTGIPEWSGSMTCHWDESDTNGQVALTIGASVALDVYGEGDASGAIYFSGTASVMSIKKSGSRDGVVSAEFEFKGNGVLDPVAAVA